MLLKTCLFQIFILLSLFSTKLCAQDMDCASKIKYRYANQSYTFDEQSKSAICYSGQKYEYNVRLSSEKEYRFSFFASTIFNNNIRFKIINSSTGELMLDLPGQAAGKNTSAILEDYFDEKQNKFIHPYYDLIPVNESNYKVIVEIGEIKESITGNQPILVDNDQKKGCVTIFMQTRKYEDFGF